MTETQSKVEFAEAIAKEFLSTAEKLERRGMFEAAVRNCYIAAMTLCSQNRLLTEPRIEGLLQRIGDKVVSDESGSEAGTNGVCLHVLREALPAGGIIGMATRWMRNDPSGRAHSVVLLNQKTRIPDALRDVVTSTGGRIYEPSAGMTFIETARWLRRLAQETASCVVLHIHNADVVTCLAFGAKGGPPVMLVNHSAHAFWVGASIVDLVANCRGSALEERWTMVHRGATRCATIPIPLVGPTNEESKVSRSEAKAAIGLEPDATVILTVGASFKYEGIKGLDFIATCDRLLQRLPSAVILAVGVSNTEEWPEAARRWKGRILALGPMSREALDRIHDATDIYIEGFPFGTTTSLLEAGLKAIPVVLAPAECPPPYGSDGVALDGIVERPESVAAYEQRVLDFAHNAELRERCGSTVRRSIWDHHTGGGWSKHLQSAWSALPKTHAPCEISSAQASWTEGYEHWSEVTENSGHRYAETLEVAIARALAIGVKPFVTPNLISICTKWKNLRRDSIVPLPVLIMYCAFLLPIIPTSWGRTGFRGLCFLGRGSIWSRSLKSVKGWLEGDRHREKGYDGYRKLSEAKQDADVDWTVRYRIESLKRLAVT